MDHQPSQSSPAVSSLAHAIFDYAIQTSADDVVDEEFVQAAGLDHLPTDRVHQDLVALYLYALLVLVSPSDTGMKKLKEEDQRALLTAVWSCYYELYLSLGALTPEQVRAKTEALVTRWDDIYEFYQQTRFDNEDPEWGTSVVRLFLQSLGGVVDPSPRQINTIASRLSYLVRTFPTVIADGQTASLKGRISRLLSHFSDRR